MEKHFYKLAAVFIVFFLVFTGNQIRVRADICDEINPTEQYFSFNKHIYQFKQLKKGSKQLLLVHKKGADLGDEEVKTFEEAQNMDLPALKKINNYMTGKETEAPLEFDFDKNQKINIADFINGINLYISNPLNYLNDMTYEEFVKIVSYYQKKATYDFEISAGEKAPSETIIVDPNLPIGPDGKNIDADEYRELCATAQLFKIGHYKIKWTEKEIPYSLIIPKSDNLKSRYGVQVCYATCVIPIIGLTVPIGAKASAIDEYRWVLWRPYFESETPEYSCVYFEMVEAADTSWNYSHWCLIPLNESNEEVLEFGFPPSSELLKQ